MASPDVVQVPSAAAQSRSLGEILDSEDDGVTVTNEEGNLVVDDGEEALKDTEAPDGYCIECEGGLDYILSSELSVEP